MFDFEAFELPALAVACPACGRGVGLWCEGPNAINVCEARMKAADAAFVMFYGPKAWIENTTLEDLLPKRSGFGIWKIRAPLPA